MHSDGTHSVPVVVLTGGIASGKTTVSDRLAELGVPVLDTDLIAREVVAPGSAGLASVVQTFGKDITLSDGSLDRKALGRRVFADDQARKQLESILHPLIERSTRDQIKALHNVPYCLVVVPLLVETGLFPDADLVVSVDVPEHTQRERLKARDGLSDDAISQILNAQASREQRLARADIVLSNDGSSEMLSRKAERLHQNLIDRFQG
jgi:dephospho-CoA kinase